MAIAKRKRSRSVSFKNSKKRRFAGTASAATLGFIGGNLPGAYYAGRYAWSALGPSVEGLQSATNLPDAVSGSGKFRPTGRRHGKHREMTRSRSRSGTSKTSRRKGVMAQNFTYCRAWTSSRRFKMPRGLKRMLGQRFIRSITSTKIVTPTGNVQSVADLNLFTAAAGPPGVATQYAMGFADTEAMIDNLEVDSTNLSFATGAWRFKIDHIRIETRMKNMTNVPVQVRLYDIVARRDDEGVPTLPSAAWQLGLAEQNSTLGLVSTNTLLGAEPYESVQFTQRFKVLKRSQFMLGAGSEHTHVIRGNPPYILDRALTSKYTYIGKRTRFLMAVVEGGITHDSASPTSVNVSKHSVDFVTEYKAKFYSLEKARSVYVAYSNLFAVGAGTEATITEDTDLPATVVNA